MTGQSGPIAAMGLESELTPEKSLTDEARPFANDKIHTALIVRGIEKLLTTEGMDKTKAKRLLIDVICHDTTGKFCEVASYEWLIRHFYKVTAQVDLPNSNYSPLRGTAGLVSGWWLTTKCS
jgi:hypothetical protein